MNMITQKRFIAMLAYVKSYQKGYITLISVLIIGTVGVAITLSLLLLGLGSSRTSFALEQSNMAKSLADSCVEEALNKLRLDSNYSGDETINFNQGSCYISSIIVNGNERTIQAQGTVNTIIRRVEVTAQVIPTMQIISWQEKAEF